jgi:hypothetical protein
MLLELTAFYSHHRVRAGDTICLYRNLQTNLLQVEIERGEGQISDYASTGSAPLRVAIRPETAAAAAAAAQHAASVAAAALAAGQLAGEVWGHHTKAKDTDGRSSNRSGVEGEGSDSDWDYSPTARRSNRARGKDAARRVLHSLLGSADNSEVGTEVLNLLHVHVGIFQYLFTLLAGLSACARPAGWQPGRHT